MSETREAYYNSTAPLSIPPRLYHGLNWLIGVKVRPVEVSPALGRGADLEFGSVELWQLAGGAWVPEAELEERINTAQARILADVDAVIFELWQHRERLATEHLRRTGQYTEMPIGLAATKLLRDEVLLRHALEVEVERLRQERGVEGQSA